MIEMSLPARNLAELLCDLGRVLRSTRHRGAGTKAASVPLQSLRRENQLALRFVQVSAAVQLRAMVEDWSLHRIHEAIAAQRVETVRPEQ
jgi:hypothetical protein